MRFGNIKVMTCVRFGNIKAMKCVRKIVSPSTKEIEDQTYGYRKGFSSERNIYQQLFDFKGVMNVNFALSYILLYP